ncbi:MAG: D-amino-acid transaminase [Pseudomonadota bacterium]
MARVIYVDGVYHPYHTAGVHPEDRGYQFGDAVYEVCEVKSGAIVDQGRHIARLQRSLDELKITMPMTVAALQTVIRETVRRNRVHDGTVYLQVSRGTNKRDFLFPPAGTRPTLVCLARPADPVRAKIAAENGITVISEPDPRWSRCDIKTVMLLPASLAKERARDTGSSEVWFTDRDGFVTEGGSSNAWIVTRDRELITTPVSNAILRGVTRTTLIDLINREGYRLVERQFTIAEAKQAQEAFITSASNVVMPVTEIDGAPVGNRHPGGLTLALRESFHEVAEIST